ncbi:MAG: PorT family protein [Bacteroidales bacterium]|nr:PorT family protein [Bacteroidales bacterium]
MKHLFREHFLKKEFVYILFSITICIYFTGNTIAQENEGSSSILENINYGVKFGTTITQFTNQQPHTTIKQGITAGLLAGYNLNDYLSLQLELNYLQEGGRLLSIEHSWDLNRSSWYLIKTDNQNITLHNLDIPIMLKYSYSLGTSKIFIVLGPALGINFNSSIKHETTVLSDAGNTSTYTETENITNSVERYNVGISAGLGFEIPVLINNYILIDARYRYGLMPVYNGYSYRGIPQITDNLQNNTMYFTIGFGF